VYQFLLCWRYLKTRYLAMLCIASVMLGVATLIVVNSVMGGFSKKLRERLHGLLSDVVIEAWDYNGFPDAEGKMEAIREDPFLSERIQSMTYVVESFAMLQFHFRGQQVTRTVRLIGIDAEERSRLGGFEEYLVHNRGKPAFHLSMKGQREYDRNHPFGWMTFPEVEPGEPVEIELPFEGGKAVGGGQPKPPPAPPPSQDFVPERLIVGQALAFFRDPRTGKDVCMLAEGDDVVITTVSGGKLRPVWARFVVCDYFRSGMSEYDANYAFVPRDYLQKLTATEHRATSIQIRLKDYAEADAVVKRLGQVLKDQPVTVLTWEKKQGPLLSAIKIERGLLNILLFLIIAVAGFGILAIFSMIVVEKTRDIGILKALGASNRGVMRIFLGYGLLLGIVGCVLGTALGITLTLYINEVEHVIATVTGQEIFPRDVYYFKSIPTYISPVGVALINAGAIAIAVIFSVVPALRAAMLHPVRALRYE
jgi:lipoprotein-releasing system permease protein